MKRKCEAAIHLVGGDRWECCLEDPHPRSAHKYQPRPKGSLAAPTIVCIECLRVLTVIAWIPNWDRFHRPHDNNLMMPDEYTIAAECNCRRHFGTVQARALLGQKRLTVEVIDKSCAFVCDSLRMSESIKEHIKRLAQTVAAIGWASEDNTTCAFEIPTDERAVADAWSLVLDELEGDGQFSVCGPLRHARVLRWTADALDLGFPVDVHAMGEMAAEKTKIDALHAKLRAMGCNSIATVRLLEAPF